MPGATHSHSLVTVPATLIEGLEREIEYQKELIGRALMKMLPVYEGTDNMETAELLDRMTLAIASSEAEGGE